MIISFSPQLRYDALIVSKAGDVLTINGEAFDFTSLPDGATLPQVPCEFIAGSVERIDGAIHLTLRLPYRLSRVDVEAPAPISPENGVVVLPDLDTLEETADVDA